ncbi:MAG: hypothetical protein JRJ66_02735 [Deltaproteobacteria bacterium]|nr:hypothetical protein [Deltaproteobacteria bacterium]MBW2045296.1 hypothetical protein [Deltaproteobacteria bacterium]
MNKYEVFLYYSAFLTRTVEAENEEEAILKARDDLNAPCNRETFKRRFEPILETLCPWHDCDSARQIS